MCWSGEASTVLATVGISGALYAAYKKEPASLWGTLLYFAMMEALQAYTYTVINQCQLPSNQIATVLGYLHIAFQPFFINADLHAFRPGKGRRAAVQAGLCDVFRFRDHHAVAALSVRMGGTVRTGPRALRRAAVLGQRQLAYRLGRAGQWHRQLDL